MSEGLAFPELLSRRDDVVENGAWTVKEGSTMRGAASCNLGERILEVPLGPSAPARAVRAHELMHARVSPHVSHLERALDEVLPRALECAEEFRVNTLLGRLHFDVSLLRDGTEKIGGQRVAEAGEWAEAACFLIAVLGTGGEKEYLAGLRRARPTWLPALRALRKGAMNIVDHLSTETIGATALNDEGLPRGYVATTLPLARILTHSMMARVPATPEQLRAFRRSLDVGARRPVTGQFATLVLDETLLSVSRLPVGSTRRRRASTSGVALRYPNRLLSDPRRRAFTQRARRDGGIIVIDQSGSMDLDAKALERLVRDAPSALVIGYSHRPGDLGATPNAWLLCDRGRVATSYPPGNVGNGVDGPVLRWALSRRRGDEAVVWVTDGQVTDSHDHPDEALSEECATLIRRHRVRLVREVTDAARALRSGPVMTRSKLAGFGRVGRELLKTP